MKNKKTRFIAIFTSALFITATGISVSADGANETDENLVSSETASSPEDGSFEKRYKNSDGTEYVKKYTPLDFCFTGWYKVEGGSAEMQHSTGTNAYIRNGHREYLNSVYFTLNNPGGQERGGMDRWDCGLYTELDEPIKAGELYKVRYIITSNCDGEFYTRIGDSDDHDAWHNNMGFTELEEYTTEETEITYSCTNFAESYDTVKIEAGYYYHFTCYYRSTKNIEKPIWEFQFGGAGSHQPEDCFPEGAHIQFASNFTTVVSEEEVTVGDERITPEYVKAITQYPDMKDEIDEILAIKEKNEYTKKTTQIDDRCYHNWFITEGGPAVVNAEVENCTWEENETEPGGRIDYLNINIQNPGGKNKGGQDRWDAGMITDLGPVEKDNYYYIEYTVEPSENGELYTRIGNREATYDIWNNNTGFTETGTNAADHPNKKNEYDFTYGCLSKEKSFQTIKLEKDTEYKFSCFIKADKDIEDTVWEFNFGGAGTYQLEDCFPENTTLKFRDFAFYKVTEDSIAKSDLCKRYAEDYDLEYDVAAADILNCTLSEKIDFNPSEIHAAPGGNNNTSIENTVLFGDLNGDGVAELTDLSILSVLLMNKDKEISDSVRKAADVDCNGEVDIADLARFKQYISHDSAVPMLGKTN